jgi:hypothetical protein
VEWAWQEKIEEAARQPTPLLAAEMAIELARFTALERDKQTLEAYLMLREAWADCRGKVDGLREWSEEVSE